MAAEQNDHEQTLSCPICLSSSEDNLATLFSKTECGHVFCTSCLEQVLCKRNRYVNEDEDIRYTCITRGNCPMCRAHIDLFDLRSAIDSSLAVGKNTDVTTWPIHDQLYRQKAMGRDTPVTNDLLNALHHSKGPAYGYGMEFSFLETVPSLIFSPPLSLHSFGSGGLENHMGCITCKLKFNDYHFHQDTMSFHGKIDCNDPWVTQRVRKEPNDCEIDTLSATPILSSLSSSIQQRIICPSYFYQNFECVLQFSPDARYIRDGYISWSYFDTTSLADQYPLDGTWECRLESGEVIPIHVQFHSFSFKDKRCHFFINDNKAWFQWPGTTVVQMSEQEILPKSSEIGETLSWQSDAAFGYEKWTRVSMNLKEVSSVVRMKPISSEAIGAGSQFIYQRVNADSDNDQTLGPSYNADSLWGNVFCQGFTVGLASYHFMKSDGNPNEYNYSAYISYENPKTGQWPDLDNGQPIPSHAYFRNIQWNEQTRTFKGDILWMEDHGTTWTGHSKWMYEITFDSTFKFIVSGTCTMESGEPLQFGRDLVYINAALWDVFTQDLESSSSTEEFLDSIRRCRDNGASRLTLHDLGEVAMSVMIRGGESIFDYNL